MNMLLGYQIAGPDNGYTMYKRSQLEECTQYRDVYSINKINKEVQLKNIKYSLSYTYDGFAIVSQKFKQFCEDEKYSGVEFIEVSGKQKYYWLKLYQTVEFDTVARETRFLNFNEICKGHEEIIGANPVYLKKKNVLPDGFFRTDICFGSFAGKTPLYLVGEITKKKMETMGFDDIDFEEVLSTYN